MGRFVLLGLIVSSLIACDDPGGNPLTPSGGVGGSGSTETTTTTTTTGDGDGDGDGDTTTGDTTGDGDGDGDGDAEPQLLTGSVCVADSAAGFVSRNCLARPLVENQVPNLRVRDRDTLVSVTPAYADAAAANPTFEYTAIVGETVSLAIEDPDPLGDFRDVVFEPGARNGLVVPAFPLEDWLANVVLQTVGAEEADQASIIVGIKDADFANVPDVLVTVDDPLGEEFADDNLGGFDPTPITTAAGTVVIMGLSPRDSNVRTITASREADGVTVTQQVSVFPGFTTVTLITFE